MSIKRKVGDLYRPHAYIKKMSGDIPVVLEIRGQKYFLEGYGEKKLPLTKAELLRRLDDKARIPGSAQIDWGLIPDDDEDLIALRKLMNLTVKEDTKQ